MMTPDERMTRAARIHAALEDGIIEDAFLAVEKELTNAIVKSPVDQTLERENLYLEIHALKRVMAKLKSWYDDGQLAKEQ